MEHGASESVKEKLQMHTTIKREVEMAATSTAHIDSEINVNHLKPELWLVQSAKRKPALLVEEEILEDICQDGIERQCVQVTPTQADTGSVNEACSTSFGDFLIVKHEMDEIDNGPTLLQHMDIHYTVSKSAVVEENTIMKNSNNTVICKGGKNVEDMLTENKKISSKNYNQTKIEGDYGEAHLKSCHGQQLLEQHLVTSSGGFKSDDCESTFRKPNILSLHKELHPCHKMKTSGRTASTDPGPSNQSRNKIVKQESFVCNICEKRYLSKVDLHFHKHSHSDFGLFVCPILSCDAKFGWKNHLANHLQIHTGEKKPFQCDKCDIKFTKRGLLTTHSRVHTGEKPFQCDTCGIIFARKADLPRHNRVHTGEKPFQCDTCDARFAIRGALTRHTRVHTGEKPFQCDTCDARFAEKCTLTKHKRIHTSEKLFTCSECGANFARKNYLNSHMRRYNTK